MIDEDRGKDSSTRQLKPRSNSIRAYVSDLICRASEEEDFDARKILEENPEVQNYRSLVLDLAYEEYCQKVESGDEVKQKSFAKRFPEFEESLLRVLQVHQYLEKTESNKSKPKVEWPKPGDIFGEYRLLELIGRGTFAFVFIAEQLNVAGRKVVLKITRDALDEIETLGRLDHPNIVQIFTVESNVDGFTAICMPLISQVTLFDLLAELHGGDVQPQHSVDFADSLQACLKERQDQEVDRTKLRFRLNGPFVDAVIRVGIDIANALKYSHERGFLHCDIKPTNILISPTGRSMLFDFNLSAKSNSKTGRIGGTLPYMPPEQLQALIDNDYDFEATRAVDMFAFGVTLYQFLTGKLPFGDIPETATQKEAAKILLERQRTTEVSFEGVKGLNKSLKVIIEQCLAFKHQLRPKTAEKVAEKLEQENSKVKRTRRWVIKHPIKTAIALSAVAMLIPGMIFGINYFNKKPTSTNPSPTEQASRYIEQGKQFEIDNSFDAAIHKFNTASKVANIPPTKRFESLCHVTVTYARSGQYSDAERTLHLLKEDFSEYATLLASIELAILNCVPLVNDNTTVEGWNIFDRNSRKNTSLELVDHNNYASLLFRCRRFERIENQKNKLPLPTLDDVVREFRLVLNKDPNHGLANLNMFQVKRKIAKNEKKGISDFANLDAATNALDDFPELIKCLLEREVFRINNGTDIDEFQRLLKRYVDCGGPREPAFITARKVNNAETRELLLSRIRQLEFKERDVDYFEYYGVANPLIDYDFSP